MRHLFTVLFAFQFVSLFSQVYSGFVTMGCSNVPMSNIELEIEGIVDGMSVIQKTKTGSNGTFSFTVSGTKSEWRMRIISKGVSYPKYYAFKTFQGNQESVHFEYLLEPTVMISDGTSEEVVNSNTSFETPYFLCKGNRNCLFIEPYNELFLNSTASHCFFSCVYELDDHGNRIKGLAKKCFSMNHELGNVSIPYKIALPNTNFLDSLGFQFEIVVLHGCCPDNGNCPTEGFNNEISYFFEVKTTPEKSVNYSFSVPLDIDKLNNNNDYSQDGIEKFATSGNGPSLGALTSGLYQKYLPKEQLNYITYNLYEVECDTFDLEEKLLITNTYESDLPFIFYSLVNFETSDGDPYFLHKENYDGKCFKVEFIAEGACGLATSFSYFTIAMINNLFDTRYDLHQATLSLYPNPATDDYLYLSNNFNKDCPENLHYTIVNLSGKVEKYGSVDCQSHSIFVRDLKLGAYFLRIEEIPNETYKFIKI